MRNIFLFFILSFGLAKSQISSIVVSNNNDNLLINNINPTILTSDNNVTISGILMSEKSFIIRPDKSYSIVIRPRININSRDNGGNDGIYIVKGKGGTGKITIVPNPVADNLHVTVEGTEMTSYKIVGTNGTIYMQNDSISPTGQYDINVAGLPTGNYVLVVKTTSGKTLFENFIKL